MSTADSLSVEEALNKPVDEMITTKSESAESATTKPSSSVSSHIFENGGHSETSQEGEDGDVAWGGEEDGQESSSKSLREELSRVKEERNSFEAQYRGLLGKLSQMRSTLGDRLRQDAEELDRREQQIEALQGKSQELQETIETLKSELLTSHGDMERLTQEMDSVRILQVKNSSQSDRKSGEVKLRELQEMTERYRIDAESWESSCMEERAYREELALEVRGVKRERDEAIMREAEEKRRADREAQSALDLQQVLEEFQSSQESEIQRVLGDYQIKYDQVAASLEEHKERTKKAEREAREYKEGWEKCQSLEREVKEKNILIGKLRHEAVICNEHLTEALRRLRNNTSDSNVDGRLITNLILQFLNAPRSDSKRFEMLSLIGSVLNWSADEREKAGLQRGSATGTSNGPILKGSPKGGNKEGRNRSGSASTSGEEVSLSSDEAGAAAY